MDVTIYFCELCKLRQPAEAIAAALEREFQLRTEIQPAFWGTFRVVYRGVEVFDRWKSRGLIGRLGFGRTPTPDEIVELLRPRLTATQEVR